MDKKRRDLGKFRHRVTIYNVTRVADEGGGAARSDPSPSTELATVWADVSPVTGRELYWSQQLVENVTHSVKIRWRSDIEDGMLLKFDGIYFYIITSIDPTNLNEFLYLACREGGPL